MKMLKPFFGPHDCGSTFATSPTAPTRRLPPGFGCPAPEAAAATVGAAVVPPPALAGAAGATCVGAAGAATPHAAASVAVVTVTSRPKAWRRLTRPDSKRIASSLRLPGAGATVSTPGRACQGKTAYAVRSID